MQPETAYKAGNNGVAEADPISRPGKGPEEEAPFQGLEAGELRDLPGGEGASPEGGAAPPAPEPGQVNAGEPPPAEGPGSTEEAQETPVEGPGTAAAARLHPPRRRWAWIAGAVFVIALLALAAVAGRRFLPPAPAPGGGAETAAALAPGAPASAPPPAPAPEGAIPPEWWALESRLREIDALRVRLEAKRVALRRLQAEYAYGVLELEEEALPLLREEGGTLMERRQRERALALLVENLQRRAAGRDGLGRAISALERAAEELLFLKRRALLEKTLQGLFAATDPALRFPEIDRALAAGEEMLMRPPAEEPHRPPLEAIRRELVEKAKTADLSPERRRDLAIAAEICAGDLGRAAELSSLTLRAARCLAESPAADLFLTGVRRIRPEAAARLAAWRGDWLCLNGLQSLPPEIARALASWQGRRLSLNGLGQLSEESARELGEWPGAELELMGLKGPAGVDPLLGWERRGRTLRLPAAVRAVGGGGGSPAARGAAGGPQAGG